MRRFRLEGRDTAVELSVSMPLATYWLLPRLADFRARHPQVELRVSTVDTDRLIGIDDADLWIPAGLGDWPHLDEAVFDQECIYPVAAPDHPLSRPDTTPAELPVADLLVHGHHARFDRDTWFTRHDHPAPATVGTPRFGGYSLVIRAARAGQGVALGWDHLVRDMIRDGHLARVGSDEIVTENPLVVLARPASLTRPAVRALWHWLVATADRPDSRTHALGLGLRSSCRSTPRAARPGAHVRRASFETGRHCEGCRPWGRSERRCR